jgi:hypothetical protein
VSLLKLTPESERLRRLAKAHAAGELATPEYRQMRAQVIERLGTSAVAVKDASDVTERRARAEASTETLRTPHVAPPPPVAPTPTKRVRWRRYAVGVGTALLLWLVATHAFASAVLQ